VKSIILYKFAKNIKIMTTVSIQTSSPEAIAFARELMKIKREAQAELRALRDDPEFKKTLENLKRKNEEERNGNKSV
jgi:hypothetical protein